MSVVPDSIRYLRVRRISGEVKYFFALPNSPTRRELPLGENRDLAIDRLYELLLVHRLQNRSESNNIAFAIQLFQEFELRHLDKLTVIENRKVIQRLLAFLKLRNFDIKDLGSTEFILSYQLWLGFNTNSLSMR
jgi:hypothetical protein